MVSLWFGGWAFAPMRVRPTVIRRAQEVGRRPVRWFVCRLGLERYWEPRRGVGFTRNRRLWTVSSTRKSSALAVEAVRLLFIALLLPGSTRMATGLGTVAEVALALLRVKFATFLIWAIRDRFVLIIRIDWRCAGFGFRLRLGLTICVSVDLCVRFRCHSPGTGRFSLSLRMGLSFRLCPSVFCYSSITGVGLHSISSFRFSFTLSQSLCLIQFALQRLRKRSFNLWPRWRYRICALRYPHG